MKIWSIISILWVMDDERLKLVEDGDVVGRDRVI